MSKKKKQSGDTHSHGSSETPEAPVQRGNLLAEGTEPWAEGNPIPMVLVILLAILCFAGDMYLMANRGDFDARVYEPFADYASIEPYWPIDPVIAEARKGRKVYETVCAACHQGSGMGAPGQFPPLAGSDWVQAEGANRIIRIVLNGASGPITVNGQSFNNAMPPWGPVLKDDEISAVVTYIRREWGNKGSGVTEKEVAAIRAQVTDHAPWAADDLLKIPAK
ncbi:MAG TPA: hypothetical protein DCM86_14095 [Verrucomicrobiales bacterium]|nr:hypothetical protein [Verrucomicrobiales bacterium]